MRPTSTQVTSSPATAYSRLSSGPARLPQVLEQLVFNQRKHVYIKTEMSGVSRFPAVTSPTPDWVEQEAERVLLARSRVGVLPGAQFLATKHFPRPCTPRAWLVLLQSGTCLIFYHLSSIRQAGELSLPARTVHRTARAGEPRQLGANFTVKTTDHRGAQQGPFQSQPASCMASCSPFVIS